jgi:hypothetical protein
MFAFYRPSRGIVKNKRPEKEELLALRLTEEDGIKSRR